MAMPLDTADDDVEYVLEARDLSAVTAPLYVGLASHPKAAVDSRSARSVGSACTTHTVALLTRPGTTTFRPLLADAQDALATRSGLATIARGSRRAAFAADRRCIISVSVNPGQTAVNVTPHSAYSFPRVRLKPMR